MADALTIRLRVLEESRATVHLRTSIGPVGTGGDVPALPVLDPEEGTGEDIMAIAFILLMEAAKSARDDLKSIMADVKSINAAKDRLRREMQRTQERASHRAMKSPQPRHADADSVFEILLTAYWISIQDAMDQLQDDLDSMSEMGEMESLRLQMAMDRVSKLMSTLSNLLKKLADTQQQLVQNLK